MVKTYPEKGNPARRHSLGVAQPQESYSRRKLKRSNSVGSKRGPIDVQEEEVPFPSPGAAHGSIHTTHHSASFRRQNSRRMSSGSTKQRLSWCSGMGDALVSKSRRGTSGSESTMLSQDPYGGVASHSARQARVVNRRSACCCCCC